MNTFYYLLNTITSDIYRISGLFLVLTALFHFFLIYKRSLSLKKWKLVEYIWVVLAFISTLGIVDQSRRTNAMATLTQAEIQLDKHKEQLIGWFDNYQELTCIEQFNEKQCNAFNKAQRDIQLLLLENIAVPDIDHNILNHVSHLSLIMTDMAIAEISLRINKYSDNKVSYLTTKLQTQQSTLQRLINLLTPLLLAFALALKMTKVTAEYLAYKHKV